MGKYKFTATQRFALWKAWDQKCALCGEPIPQWENLTIDHIIPEDLLEKPDELRMFLRDYGLSPNFNLNTYDNWIPTNINCNRQKSNKMYDKSACLHFINLAKDKVKKAQDLEKQFDQNIEDSEIIAKFQAIVERKGLSQKRNKEKDRNNKEDPTELERLMDFAQAAIDNGKFERAREYYLDALRLTTLSESIRSEIQFNYAAVLDKLGEYKTAIEVLNDIIEDLPQDGLAHSLMGHLLRMDNRNEDALEYLEISLKSAPFSFGSYFEKGKVYENLKDFDKAAVIFDRLLIVDSKNILVWTSIIHLLFYSKRYAATKRVLNDYLKLFENAPEEAMNVFRKTLKEELDFFKDNPELVVEDNIRDLYYFSLDKGQHLKNLSHLMHWYNLYSEIVNAALSGKYILVKSQQMNRYYLEVCEFIEKLVKEMGFEEFSTKEWKVLNDLYDIDEGWDEEVINFVIRDLNKFHTIVEMKYIQNKKINFPLPVVESNKYWEILKHISSFEENVKNENKKFLANLEAAKNKWNSKNEEKKTNY